MAYDDDDLFGEEFDFVDEDDDASDVEEDADAEEPKPAKPKRRPAAKDKAPPERKGRGKAPAAGRRPRAAASDDPPPEREPEAAPVDEDEETVEALGPREEAPPEPVGPPADHLVHVYEHGRLKRTIPRKFTDEEAVSFAEEYTRTGKAYGRYAVATPDDEEPSPTFAGASRGS